MSENDDLLEFARTVNCRDNQHEHMNCAMISCHVSIIDYGRLVHSRKFPCFSYSELHGGLSGLFMKKDGNGLFHFTTHTSYIMIYPSRNDNYQPQELVDYFYYIRKTIDKNAKLMSYERYQEIYRHE